MEDQTYAEWQQIFTDRGFDSPRIVDWTDRGWWPIIGSLLDDLEAMGFSKENFTVAQVKEKFGGGRFYFTGGWDENLKFESPAFKRVAQFEQQSYLTCEQCGQPGQLRKGGWLKTLCDEHANGRMPTTLE